MNIGQLIENPFQDLSPYTSDLEKLMQKNSYSSTIMMLYLKALKDGNSIDFEDNLKKTAILCQDRTVLFDFIKNEHLQSAPILDKVEAASEEQKDQVPIEKPEVLEELSEVKTENIEVKPATDQDKETEEKETVQDDHLEATSDEKEDSIFELNKDIYARAVHASIHNEDEEDDSSTEETQEEAISSKPEKSAPEEQEKKQSDDLEAAGKEAPAQPEVKHSGEKLSFIDWLKAQQGQRIEGQKTSDEVQDEEPKSKEKITEKDEPEEDHYRSDINAIVEKFIKEEPTITRRKAEFFSPSETAKKSIEENDNIVTETLAEIYVNQGNYKKAIAAYEQLILKFPKKKSFFADRINFIKNLK